jgi:hypothetical protein
MIEGGYAINKRGEVVMAMEVKWWVKDGVVIVAEIVLKCSVRCHQVHRE